MFPLPTSFHVLFCVNLPASYDNSQGTQSEDDPNNTTVSNFIILIRLFFPHSTNMVILNKLHCRFLLVVWIPMLRMNT